MSWSLVPLDFRPIGFFDRQRDLFSDWKTKFDDSWAALDFDTSLRRFDTELAQIKKDLFKLDAVDTKSSMLNIEQPYVTDANGQKKLSLRFDTSQFKPEEISVKTTGNQLSVHAKHVEESEGRKEYREFTREYTLPKDLDPASLRSTLSKDGVLQIEAPAPASIEAPNESLVPIEKL